MKKQFGWLAAALVATQVAWATGTVVVAPARINVIQVGMDLAARPGVTLVSYQGEASTAKPLIHTWNGKEWEFVALEAFQSGAFLTAKPSQTLVIGDEKLVPEVFAPMSAWAGKVTKIPSLATPDIVNAAGTALKFRSDDWQWYAARYNMKVEDINAEARKDSVYNHKVGDSLKLHRKDTAPQTVEVAPPAVIEIKEPKKAETDKPVDKPAGETSAVK
ncbi:MAG: hypothetical protein NTY53_22350 [Kiritimatiellaeota bacterium]|nr:hypothetical protein [Kiritimatiellota bacterium]